MGGLSSEREVSLSTGNSVVEAMTRKGLKVFPIDVDGNIANNLKGIDLAFNALHGTYGEDGCIQGALEYLDIPYTGSNVLGSALSMDKARSKQIWQTLGLPTAKYRVIEQGLFSDDTAKQVLAELSNKVMVKPCHEGSSIGMAMANNEQQLNDALEAAFAFDEQVLVEQWIDGPEYTVAIVGGQALPVIHMETPREFYDYKAKYQSTSTIYRCPCDLSEDEQQHIKQLSLKAFNATGASGWGRVDLMRSSNGDWQLLEVNTVPGMTETSLVPKAAEVFGWSFSALVVEIVKLSIDSENQKGTNTHG
mgnify:CR=1 FL=1